MTLKNFPFRCCATLTALITFLAQSEFPGKIPQGDNLAKALSVLLCSHTQLHDGLEQVGTLGGLAAAEQSLV